MHIRAQRRHRHWPRILCAGLIAAVPAAVAVALHRPPAPPADRAGMPPAAAALHPAAAHLPATSQRSAADLAIRLQALLGQHSVLASDLMRGRIRGDDDFAQAANAALGSNTDEMSALVRQLFGDAAAKAFAPMWSGHIVALFQYAGALADHDDAARATARATLLRAEQQLGDFFAGASHGRLPQAAARAAVTEHVSHLTMQADAYAAGDYATSDRLYRECFQHTYDLGLTLDEALLPAADRATLRQPVWRLRSQLGKLLAEHAVLIEDVSRAAVTGTPDFAAAGQMINGNTQDLTAAIDTLFGAAAAKRFQSLWGSHVEQLVAYGAATAAKDPARQQRARDGLGAFERGMAPFLGTASGHRLGDPALASALAAHDQMLLRHADAYGAKDYTAAHDIAYRTYGHMFDLARTLADAFGATVAARVPRGGAQTGYGGMAGR
jgi:hypothetical protein